MRRDVECPYCGEWQEIDHSDGRGYAENEIHQQECGDCEKTFVFDTGIIYVYDAEKADCLNGGEHDWKETNTFPKKFTNLECSVCGEQKAVSPERLQELVKEDEEWEAKFEEKRASMAKKEEQDA